MVARLSARGAESGCRTAEVVIPDISYVLAFGMASVLKPGLEIVTARRTSGSALAASHSHWVEHGREHHDRAATLGSKRLLRWLHAIQGSRHRRDIMSASMQD